MKKGSKSWKPASHLETQDKDPNYGYRFVRKDDDNIARKLAEGWEFANKTTDSKVQLDTTEQVNPVTGGRNVRELVLMRAPREMLEAREAYFNDRTDHQERGLKAELEGKAGAKDAIHGDIKIETIN